MVTINFKSVALALVATLPTLTVAQSCPSPTPSGKIQPSLASGYRMQVVATGLSSPRGIAFDSAGNLLVVEKGRGLISALVLKETNGCVAVSSSNAVTSAMSLNHGIEISDDGKTLYGSTVEAAYSWAYNSATRSVSGQKLLLSGMTNDDHTTRTLLLSRKVPGLLVVTRGSGANLDSQSTVVTSGRAQVKVFNLSKFNGTAFNYNNDGTRLGWGVRNDVGVAEHPNSGGIYTVENSADQLRRNGVDIHLNNPAEEMNFLGYLNGTKYARQGDNFGYPWCFSAWNTQSLPNNQSLSVGSQFAIDATSDLNNQNKTDAYCATQAPARLVFEPHRAPLDIKFNNTGKEAWVTFHGSWNTNPPAGYKLSRISFNSNGEPVDPLTSTTAAVDIFGNKDNTQCPGNCFRPVGIAFDKKGRLFMSSDASGEIYLISKI